MSALNPIPEFSAYITQSLSSGETLTSLKVREALEKEGLAPLQPDVEAVLGSIEEIERALIELDQKRSSLSLPQDFLSLELCSLIHLQERMTLFAESTYEKASLQIKEIEGARSLKGSKDLPVARLRSIAPSKAQDPLFESVSLSKDLNWKKIDKLPRLELSEGLPSAFLERAKNVAQYEQVMNQIIGTEESIGLRTHAFKLQKIKTNLNLNRSYFLKDLSLDLGFVEGSEYSEKFKYLRYPKEDIKALLSLNLESKSSFEQLKILGLNLVEKAKESCQMEMVEVYLHLRLFLEYSTYIDAYYCNLDQLSEEDFENEKAYLKIEIANCLSLAQYFWNRKGNLSFQALGQIEQKLFKYRELLPRNVVIQVDQLTKELVKTLHQKGLIEAWVQKRGNFNRWMQEKESDFSAFEKYQTPAFGVEPKQRLYFSPSSTASSSDIRHQIVEFLRSKTLCLKKVLPVEENAFFQDKKSSTYFVNEIQKVHSPCKGRHLNLKELSEALQLTQRVSIPEGKIYTSLASYGVSSLLFWTTKEEKGSVRLGYLDFQETLRNLDEEIELILEGLPIGLPRGAGIEDKLAAIADFLLHHPPFIEQQILIEAEGMKQGLDERLELKSHPPDSIREFFREYIRYSLRQKQDELEKKLLLAFQEKKQPFSISNQSDVLKKIKEIKKELDAFKRDTAEFAVQIYNLYERLYSLEDGHSLLNLCLKAQASLLEGAIDYESEEAFYLSLEKLKFTARHLAPSLFLELNQFLTSLRINHIFSSFLAVQNFSHKEREASKAVEKLHSEYQKQTKALEKTRTRDKSCDQMQLEKANQAFNLAYLENAQPLLNEGLVEEFKVRFYQRKVQSFNARIQNAKEFDLRVIDPEQIHALRALSACSNPHLDMWVQALKMKAEILLQAHLRFKDYSNKRPLSSLRVLGQKEHRVREAISKSIDALDLHLDYFNLALPSQSIPTSLLVPHLFGIEGGHFFSLLSPEQIACSIEEAYLECEKKLLNLYKQDIEQLSQEKEKALIEEQKSRLACLLLEQNKVREALKSFNEPSEEEFLKKGSLVKTKVLIELEKEVQGVLDLEKRRAALQNKKELLEQALQNSEISLSQEASFIFNKSSQKIEAELQQVQSKLDETSLSLTKKGKELDLWSVFSPEEAFEKLSKAKEVSFEAIEEKINARKKISESKVQIEEQLLNLEREILSLKVQIQKRAEKIEQTQDYQSLEKLQQLMRQKALQLSFEMFGFPFPSKEFEVHPYFQIEKEG